VSSLDTNVIVRHLAQDNSDQQLRADAFFRELASGAGSTRLPEGVLVESVQVLESKNLYNTPRDVIRVWLTSLLGLHGLRIPNKRLYYRSLDLYASFPRLSFVDCLCVAYGEREGDTTVVTFDRDFDRVPSIRRQEP
jgi:predicted nucleic-acid-binding protein